MAKQITAPLSRRPRILLADDHTMLLDAFRRLLEPQFDIVGTATDGRALVELAVTTAPDVVILDIAMPRLNGMEAAAQLRRKLPGIKIVFLTVNEDPDIAAEAIRLGASAFLLKSSASSELISAIELALAGKTYITPLITRGKPLEPVPERIRQARRRQAHRPPARGAATACRGAVNEGSGRHFEADAPHGGFP